MRDGHLFFLGFGYCAARLAAILREEGAPVVLSGTTRTEEKVERAAQLGVKLHLFDGKQPMAQGSSALAEVTHLVASITSDAEGDVGLRAHRELLRSAPSLRWVGYLSSAGVYGDTKGEWVDEQTVPAPAGQSSGRLAAEAQWLALGLERDVPVSVLRLGGIYGPGPGRNALALLKAGTARRVVRPGLVFNRIHVDDIAWAVRAAAGAPAKGVVYNVVDDKPLPPQEVTEHAARLLGMEPPPEVPYDDPSLPPFVRGMYSGYNRVKNDKIKAELGFSPKYPDILQGLTAIHAQGG